MEQKEPTEPAIAAPPDWPIERITLAHGPLRFSAETCGDPAAPLALCLHGFPDAPQTWRALSPSLAEAGFYAVAPTLRGYEPSSQPAGGDYRLPTLVTDVIAWIDQLGADRAHLIGHDWGAIIAYQVAAAHPDRLNRLVTMAIPHTGRAPEVMRRAPHRALKSWYTQFFQIPGLAEAALQRNDWALIRRLWRDWSPGYRLSASDWGALRAVFAAPGVKQAMLAYYRQNLRPLAMLGLTRAPFTSLGPIATPTLAIIGERDGCVDSRLSDRALRDEDFPGGLRVERIPDAGHFAHLERPDQVARLVLAWLSAAKAPPQTDHSYS